MRTGEYGEEIASKYLKKKGYSIKERNFHSRYGEIDIIAENDKYLLFVEVKTRSENAISTPQSAVTALKQEKIIKTAKLWLIKNRIEKQPRFDVIAITLSKSGSKVEEIVHLENAFGTYGF